MSTGRLLIVAILIVSLAAAQAGDAEISGQVKDPSGAVVAGATVTATNQESGVTRTTTVGPDGRYRFVLLPPGRYSLKVEAAGFRTETVTDITLNIGFHLERNISLTVGAVQEAVIVVGEVPPIDTSKAEIAGVVTDRQI